MAKVKKNSLSIKVTDNFNDDEWLYFQNRLGVVDKVFKELSKKYGISELHDTRWPVRGLLHKKLVANLSIKVMLNHDYFENKSNDYGVEFYELIIASWNHVPFLYYKNLGFDFVGKIPVDKLQDYEFLHGLIEAVVKKERERKGSRRVSSGSE